MNQPMNQPLRTASGGRIDRQSPLRFTFDGTPMTGLAGDTLASALLANGVHLVGRSYKYHRPRGILTAGSEEPNALVGIVRGPGRVTPNLRATQVELYDGLKAVSQNRWPSLRWDIGAINTLLAPLYSAGFYYKTFFGPKGPLGPFLWKKLFEPVIRHAAGLGAAPEAGDPDYYAQLYQHCDVLVIGGGAAGIGAALAAAEAGASVILCDEQQEFGGALLSETRALIECMPALQWLIGALARLRKMPNVRLLARTQAFGYYAQNFVALQERVTDHLPLPDEGRPRERLWQVRAKEVVLATGAIERPLVFPGNDRPGVMLAQGAQVYLTRYGVKPGHRIVVASSCDSAVHTALDLADAGCTVALVAEIRNDLSPGLQQALSERGIPLLLGATITGTQGLRRITQVGIARMDKGHAVEEVWQPCDCLLMSGGWTPSVHLFSQSRGKLVFDPDREVFLPGTSVQNERSVGACKGSFDLQIVLREAMEAGAQAAQNAGYSVDIYRVPTVTQAPSMQGHRLGVLPGAADGKAFVDFQNDVCASDIKLAVREGMRSIEHIKRYTTTGMATDQGKLSNMNALAIAAAAQEKSLPTVGLTTFRQPYTPVTFGSFAGVNRGDLFDPVRKTPIHGWAEGQGAKFEDVGLWKRAWYFPRPGETMHQAVARECRQTRASAGMFDASTLGKIEVVGPDAAAFLDRLYTNPLKKLEIGRARYGLMLNEQGFVMDDGIVARLAEDRFHITTTTGGAPRVLAHMEDYLQTEFTDLKLWLTSTTEQWAVIAVQGPRARDIIAPLVEKCDLSNTAMPHMSIRAGRICGVPARIMRVSFTGELGYEINVPADAGLVVWQEIWARGQAFDVVAYGTEAMHVLRAEKGYIIVGQETDGTVTPQDLGLTWAIGRAKPDFVGKRSLVRPDMLLHNRPQLVGLLTDDPEIVLEEGAALTRQARPEPATASEGHVTSAYFSPALGRSIALAMIKNGRARLGEKLHVPMPGGSITVRVAEAVFHDAAGERLHA